MSADIESSDAAPVAVFISYRRAEAAGWARALYERLVAEFGRANVFLDQASIPPGQNWAEQLHEECTKCTALIALIGPEWTTTLDTLFSNEKDDYVREEIEKALEAGGEKVIPALIDDAPVLNARDDRHLRRVLREKPRLEPLLKNQMAKLSPSSGWDADVKGLIDRLKQLGIPMALDASPPSPPQTASALGPEVPTPPASESAAFESPSSPDPSSATPVPAKPAASAASKPSAIKNPPSEDHYKELAALMLNRVYRVVPFLGPGVNSCGRDRWEGRNSKYLPDSDELAEYLADLTEQMGVGGAGAKEAIPSLAFASQDFAIRETPRFLYRKLEDALVKKELLSSGQPDADQPGAVHRFLANLPKKLDELNAPESCQLIVTTNYDNALEQAFEKANEPYDLAVYVPSKGTFFHVPYEGKSRQVDDPNQDHGFPMCDRGWLERPVIMKIHGTIVPPEGSGMSKDDCVITEDDYIDYMKGPIESIVPNQLLAQLQESRLLFLGHELDDWSLRVFLLRVFSEQPLSDTSSWAIQGEPSELDRRFWKKMGVEHFGIPLNEYVEELGTYLEHPAGAAADGQSQE